MSRLGFPAQASQAFCPSGVGGLEPDSAGNNKALTFPRRATASHCVAENAVKLTPQHPIEVEGVTHSSKGLTDASFIHIFYPRKPSQSSLSPLES